MECVCTDLEMASFKYYPAVVACIYKDLKVPNTKIYVKTFVHIQQAVLIYFRYHQNIYGNFELKEY
jgi:hypothetical protein